MRSIVFQGNTWEKYEELRAKNKTLHKKLCKILKEMQRGVPSKGSGKPELLKGNLSEFWSRRLNEKDRLIYKYDETNIHIFAIGDHYGDK